MIVVLVHIHVKEEAIEGFKEAIMANATESVKEPGVARFDVIQQRDDPQRFVLVEAYFEQEAIARHKETPHYLAWREAAEPMMVEPRQGIPHLSVWPEDQAW
jgi:autoinducer 2-degrading protein